MVDISKNISSQKSAFAWNVIGSMCNAASSLIYLLAVTRINGPFDSGIFAIAFANAQLMLTIGIYGMRTFQATDLKRQFSFQNYLTSRFITCSIMFISSIIFILLKGYSLQKAQIVLWVCLLKMVDAAEDVFHGLFQQNNRMDIAGKLLTLRNIFSMIAFFVLLVITKKLLFTCVFTAILSFVFCFMINLYFTVQFEQIKFDFSLVPLKKLLIECFPLFAASFLSLYIYNASKYAIDNYLTEDIQTYYNILFMPTFIINLFSEFAFKPLLTVLAELWLNNKIKEFISEIIILLKWIGVLTVVALIGGYFLGIPVLSFIYGIKLSYFKIEFMILLIGGGFGASVWLFNNILTIMRKQKGLLLGYLGTSIFTSIISPILTQKSNILGASEAYLLSITFLCIFFIVLLFININKRVEA